MLDKIYLEITNVCNLSCSFCHKTKREKRFMTEEEFDTLTSKLQGRAKYLYFHLMGEPTLHPQLPKFIATAREKRFIPILTTNGSLLGEKGKILLESLPHKISISLHAPEANPTFADKGYLDSCIEFSKKAAARGCIVVLRLWNLGTDADNSDILNRLKKSFIEPWEEFRGGSNLKLSQKIFLEWGEHFDWPDINGNQVGEDAEVFCYGLRNHIGVHVNGDVVPCCLDAEGCIKLGNLFESELDDILSSKIAQTIKDGFSRRRATEPLCRTCGYVKRFNIKK